MTDRFRIMVVDDDRLSRQSTAQQLHERGFDAGPADNALIALQRLGTEHWDVVLTHLPVPGMDTPDFLRRVREEHPGVEVLLTTPLADLETAIAAVRAGVADFLVEPVQPEELELRLLRIRDRAAARNELQALRGLLGDPGSEFGLVGHAGAMTDVRERIRRFADHRGPVLITGAIGTGKKLVARALHQHGARRAGPFVAVACGSLPHELAEAALFGLGKVAGSVEQAHTGTLLLEDVDALPPPVQVKLLRLLQEGAFVRSGGTADARVDVRVVATTKADLGRLVKDGTFREDLHSQLRSLTVHLPRLAERGDDVLLLAHRFLSVLAAQEGADPRRLGFALQAAQLLRSYPWPGNVAELRRAMESAYVLSGGGEIRPEHLPPMLAPGVAAPAACGEVFSLHLEGNERLPFNELLERFQDELIHWALGRAGGQQKRAADLLGIPRTTLQSRMLRLRATAQV